MAKFKHSEDKWYRCTIELDNKKWRSPHQLTFYMHREPTHEIIDDIMCNIVPRFERSDDPEIPLLFAYLYDRITTEYKIQVLRR